MVILNSLVESSLRDVYHTLTIWVVIIVDVSMCIVGGSIYDKWLGCVYMNLMRCLNLGLQSFLIFIFPCNKLLYFLMLFKVGIMAENISHDFYKSTFSIMPLKWILSCIKTHIIIWCKMDKWINMHICLCYASKSRVHG